MSEILFIATYPTEQNIKDGYFVRVKNVDNLFSSVKRTYLNISFMHNRQISIEHITPILTIIEANLFLHFLKIRRLLRPFATVYIQSLFAFVGLMFFCIRNKKVIWDVHGAVPEEVAFYRKLIRAKVFQWLEKMLAKRTSIIVAVTHAMLQHLNVKYPFLKTRVEIVLPLLSSNGFFNAKDEDVALLTKELGITEFDTVFIYVGNLQKWQRFDDVVDTMQRLTNSRYKYIILTRDVEAAQHSIAQRDIKQSVIVRSVSPEELPKYYAIAHYGFILRGEHVLNKVAAPTKLLEYMFYKIIPIVDFVAIGDFAELGYEYKSITNIDDNMPPAKSAKNARLAEQVLRGGMDGDEFVRLVIQ